MKEDWQPDVITNDYGPVGMVGVCPKCDSSEVEYDCVITKGRVYGEWVCNDCGHKGDRELLY